ncbi:hypothetical protein V3C99_003781 [Haemonchus contortus]
MFFVRRLSQLFRKKPPFTASKEENSSVVDFYSKDVPVVQQYRPDNGDELITALPPDITSSNSAQSISTCPTSKEYQANPFRVETNFCCEREARREIIRLNHVLQSVPDDYDRQHAILYYELGNAYFALKAFDTCMQLFRKSRRIARSMVDPVTEAYVCGRLADVFRKRHLFREGIFYATHHVELAEKSQDEDCKSNGYFTLASQYYFRAKYHLLESDSFEEEKDLDYRLGTLRLDLGLSTIIMDLRNSVKFYTQCSEGFSKLGYKQKLATTYYYIGDSYFLLGDCKEALNYLLKAMEIGEQFDDNHLKQLIYSKLSSTYVLLSEFQLAGKFSSEAVKTRIRMKERKTCACSQKKPGSSREELRELWTSTMKNSLVCRYS